MPFTIFANRSEPEAALELLKKIDPDLKTKTDGTAWNAVLSFGGGWFRKKHKLEINFDPEYCAAPEWPKQMLGMRNFVSQFEMTGELREKALQMLDSFQLSLGVVNEPEIEAGDDPRLGVLHALASQLDGIFFTPDALLDRNFKVLVSMDGETDNDAVFPEIPDSSSSPPATIEEDVETEPEPPTADRVARRCMCLAAIAARGLLEMNLNQGNEPAYQHADIREWCRELNLDSEFEAKESEIIATPAGKLEPQDALNSVWRLEGLAVLAWALGSGELPKYDDLVNPDELLEKLGFLSAENAALKIANAKLRSTEELERFNGQILALHWRMVNFRVDPKEVDYKHMEEECWFGKFDLSWAEFSGKDLALKGRPITSATDDALQAVSSAAHERHLASNWLAGHSSIYSETDTST